jgi:HSP20 family protein
MTTVAKYTQPRNGMISLFDHFFNDDFFNWDLMPTTNVASPNYDVIEKDGEFILDFMLPGFKKEDVSINVEDDVLTIEGERNVQEETKYNRKGSFYGKFKKSFTLPEDVLAEKIDASYKDGILSVSIPKDEKSKLSKVIEIK